MEYNGTLPPTVSLKGQNSENFCVICLKTEIGVDLSRYKSAGIESGYRKLWDTQPVSVRNRKRTGAHLPFAP